MHLAVACGAKAGKFLLRRFIGGWRSIEGGEWEVAWVGSGRGGGVGTCCCEAGRVGWGAGHGSGCIYMYLPSSLMRILVELYRF